MTLIKSEVLNFDNFIPQSWRLYQKVRGIILYFKANFMEEQMMIIKSVLDEASKYHLEVEVVYAALQWMKDNPESSIGTAIQMGEAEWLK